MNDHLQERASQSLSTNHILVATLAALPVTGVKNGAMAFATDGLKDGEVTTEGTGIPVWFDESNEGTVAAWRTFTTGAAAET